MPAPTGGGIIYEVLRGLLAMALAASSCSDCLGPELTPIPALGGAGGSASAGGSAAMTADECSLRVQASDYGELTIDFEMMMAPRDRFLFGQMPGAIELSGFVASSSPVFIREGHGEPSRRSLLLLLGELNSGSINLRWGPCLDATTRGGITFWARGEASTARVVPLVPSVLSEPECTPPSANITLTVNWQRYSYGWADFCPNSTAELTFPSELTGLGFYIEETATEPWLALDDVSLTMDGG
jgi:hypothetical protein